MILDMSKRSYGTGSLFVRTDAAGRASWYGQWRSGDALVKRKLGPKRRAGERTGITKAQAEAELRRRIEAERPTASPHERPSVEEAGRRYLDHLAGVGRKRSTLMDYESHLRVHLAPFFGAKPLHRVEARDLEAFIAAKRREGRAPKSVLNYVALLHSIFEFGQRRGWASTNPCKLVDKPRVGATDADIRFLDQAELEALLRAAPTDDVGRVDRLMWLTAAMTGLRQGELLAAPLARRRLARGAATRPQELCARGVRNAEVAPVVPLGPARRPRRRGARHAAPYDCIRRR
jgi:integrase